MNKQLLKMRAKREDLRLQAVAILSKAESEDRCLTDEENKEVERIEGEIGSWDNSIKRAEAVSSIEPNTALDADEDGGEDGEGEKRTAPIIKPTPQKENRGFASFGEQLIAVQRAAEPGGTIDQRLSTRAASGLNQSNPSDGGFLVQTDFVTELLRKTFETGLLARRVRRIPISTNSNGLKINAVEDSNRTNGNRWGGVNVYWTDEAEKLSDSKPKFRQMELTLKKLTGLCYATDELLPTLIHSDFARGGVSNGGRQTLRCA